MTMNVGFEGLTIRANHGWYPEEKILGNTFDISLKVAYELPKGSLITHLDQTIDYSRLITITRDVFSTNHDLLETLAQMIIQTIEVEWPNIKGIKLSIRKLQPMTLLEVRATLIELNTGCFEPNLKPQ